MSIPNFKSQHDWEAFTQIFDSQWHCKKALLERVKDDLFPRITMSNTCKYWDCGWCYALDNVETNADSQSACVNPFVCPYLVRDEAMRPTTTQEDK